MSAKRYVDTAFASAALRQNAVDVYRCRCVGADMHGFEQCFQRHVDMVGGFSDYVWFCDRTVVVGASLDDMFRACYLKRAWRGAAIFAVDIDLCRHVGCERHVLLVVELQGNFGGPAFFDGDRAYFGAIARFAPFDRMAADNHVFHKHRRLPDYFAVEFHGGIDWRRSDVDRSKNRSGGWNDDVGSRSQIVGIDCPRHA